jgi:hypothetical protein
VQVYKELESAGNQPYWEDVQTIVVDELAKLRRLAADHDARRDGVHQAVADDVTQVLTSSFHSQHWVLSISVLYSPFYKTNYFAIIF